MTIAVDRRWLALYFLLTTVVVGLYLLIFAGQPILPLSRDEANACFEILIPVLVGQVAVIFQWIALANVNDDENLKPSPIPSWAITLPPALALFVILAGAAALVMSNSLSNNSSFGPEGFKTTITFAVSILNASTVVLVARLFPSVKQSL